MFEMIVSVIGLLIDAMILSAGIYYGRKEKSNEESRKIYAVAGAAGLVILIVFAVKLMTALR